MGGARWRAVVGMRSVFGKQVWADEIRRWPVQTIISFVLGSAMIGLVGHVGIPTLDQLPSPLTGLGYAIIFFASSFLFFLLLGIARWATGGLTLPPWIAFTRNVAAAPVTTSLPPNDLRVLYGDSLETCRAHVAGQTYYRLLIEPPAGQARLRCSAKLVGVMAPTPGQPGNWHSVVGERLPLAWADHTEPNRTETDLVDDTGEYLNVFHINEHGQVFLGTPRGAQPRTFTDYPFEPGATYLFAVSVRCPGYQSQNGRLKDQLAASRRNKRRYPVKGSRCRAVNTFALKRRGSLVPASASARSIHRKRSVTASSSWSWSCRKVL